MTHTTARDASTMDDRLLDAGYERGPHGIWTRLDDVYVTKITRDTPGSWLVTVRNLEVEPPTPEADLPAFRLNDAGFVLDVGGGIDREAASIHTRDLTRPPLPGPAFYDDVVGATSCCQTEATIVDGELSCKSCGDTVVHHVVSTPGDADLSRQLVGRWVVVASLITLDSGDRLVTKMAGIYRGVRSSQHTDELMHWFAGGHMNGLDQDRHAVPVGRNDATDILAVV